MDIVAIIPARAGSKAIPNKNIRLVNGRPMVYYAIKNALTSKYITDVIVTTDSPEVQLIAAQLGVVCRWRDPSLCGDDVTLDAVIADAVPQNKKWDYVVTMQPTSPTLSAETLDQAIAHTIEAGADTVISVTNHPHLSWTEEDGRVVANHKERLNRQYLPPHYMETGAFMISRASVVTAKTRIGEKVGVFQVSEQEAQDVDTFADLQNISFTLKRQKVAIYVNGNNQRGLGHIYRALEIADEFYTKPDIYYDVYQTDPSVFGQTTHTLIPVHSIAELFERCKKEQYSIFINDILATSIDYMIGLRAILPEAKIVNFEDDGEGMEKADLVFNALYHNSVLPYVYTGERFYISNKLFMFYNPIAIEKEASRVFISFGGADPQNYSDRLLRIIAQPEYKDYQFLVVLGRAKHSVDALLAFNRYPNIEVLHNVSNMPELMSRCDIGITSRGRTAYELALLGIPAIAMAQNQREEKHGFVCDENGFAYLGLNPADETIEASLKKYLSLGQAERQALQDRLLKHDLKNGRKRVMTLIHNL